MENENRKYYQKLPSDRENDIAEQEKQETLSKTGAESQGNEREGQKQEELLIAVNGQAYSACPKDRPKGEYIGTVLKNGRRYYYYHCRTGGYCYETDFDREMEAVMTYGISSFPTTYFIDAQGYLVAGGIGMLSREYLMQGIDMIT